MYLRLYRESDYHDALFSSESRQRLNEAINLAVRGADDNYSYYIEMVPDPSTMFELTRHGQTFGYIETPNRPNEFDQASYVGGTTGLMSGNGVYAFAYKSGDVNIYQADDFVHAALEDNVSRFPETVDLFYEDLTLDDKEARRKYGATSSNKSNTLSYTVRRGKSFLYDSYKVWREKALLEAAVLLSRLTKSGLVRKVGVEVGDMPKEQVQQTLRRVKELFEQKTSYLADKSMSEYTNPGATENFIYYATHNGQGAITVESVGGDYDPKQLTDLDWWNNKFYSSYGIPKQYFGWTDDGAGFNGGTSLTILSSVYAKGVKRIQNTMLQALTDAINLILLNKGLKSYLNNFVLQMRAPLSQEEQDYRANFSDRVTAISNVNGLFSDVEDKARRLTILKSLITSLQLGDDIIAEIQKEIEAAEEAAKKAAEEEESGGGEGEEESGGDEDLGDLDLGGGEEDSGSSDLDLAPMPDAELSAEESFATNGGSTTLNEDAILDEDDDLPTPEEAAGGVDFTENK